MRSSVSISPPTSTAHGGRGAITPHARTDRSVRILFVVVLLLLVSFSHFLSLVAAIVLSYRIHSVSASKLNSRLQRSVSVLPPLSTPTAGKRYSSSALVIYCLISLYCAAVAAYHDNV